MNVRNLVPLGLTIAIAASLAACGNNETAPAASADAVSPPATEKASGKLLAPNTATGPIFCRARSVAVRLSGRVDVVTTAPGASKMALMTMWAPFPERGGPISRMLSSTDAQTLVPCEAPIR